MRSWDVKNSSVFLLQLFLIYLWRSRWCAQTKKSIVQSLSQSCELFIFYTFLYSCDYWSQKSTFKVWNVNKKRFKINCFMRKEYVQANNLLLYPYIEPYKVWVSIHFMHLRTFEHFELKNLIKWIPRKPRNSRIFLA